MEHTAMTFEEIWEQEERQGLQQRLMNDYSSWQRRRRIRRTAMVSLAVILIAGITIFNFHFSIPEGYDAVCCNRSGIAERHWADVAANILTTPTI
jgi:hypothetical protein